jgi:outer membrane protein OmpA-like peptidoglycan-associated protein
MKNGKVRTLFLLACTVILCGIGVASISAQQPNIKNVPAGTKFKMKGIIAARTTDNITMKDTASSDYYVVELTPSTVVKTYRKGLARGGNKYAETYLLRGLLIQVEGRGNDAGRVVAETINFDNEDLKTAQALQVRVDPIEGQTAENTANIQKQGEQIAEQGENQKKMAGQIEENVAMTAAARSAADAAMTEATRANTRINGLGEYDSVKTIVVPFATGSSTIGPKGKAIIDEAAAWVRTQDTRGWMVAVVGFADSTGRTTANKTLSEKRSNAVIGYLVSKHNLPLTRLVQPFGAGVDNPVATNDTAEGRAQNRRVEIRLMVNKGIAGQ